MLTRSTQIGEFYVMSPPQINPGAGKEDHTCDLLIYDEESDRHVRITWGEALKACCIGVLGTSDVAAGAAVVMEGSSLGLDQWKIQAEAWASFNGDAGYAGVGAVTGPRKGWGDVETYRDVRIIVARPFIEHMMHSAVLVVSGRDTGATLFGPADSAPAAHGPPIAPQR